MFQLKESSQGNQHHTQHFDEDDDIKKIKKISQVQSFFRGWLCRRRWKQIVEEYIRSEHAESMRKRNAIVFGLVECEEEYVQQLSTLVSCFSRPFKMAASSKKPIITHNDVNSIFLNVETVLFLHQIFLQGLKTKMDNWPTLQLGDLFDMLLPMLGIYQEYVRNHHFSLQILAEYKTKPEFNALLTRYEDKSVCEGRSIESFLTYPMHQIPRYIITLHELLAHTPHDHVDRQKLEFAKGKLEELSHIMHDEVSETENIRKNLAIERMIVEGCDILLDVNQIFVRQGSLIQVLQEKKFSRGRLGSFSSTFKETKKETLRQVFLFTNHLLITTRVSNGRLHLAKNFGKIPLLECSLIEDTSSDFFPFDDEINMEPSQSATLTVEVPRPERTDYNGLDFRLIVEYKSEPPISVTLVAATMQEKAAWCSDISQCIEQLHYSDLLNSSLAETSSVSMPHHIRSDPKLFRDDFDIKFSRTLNSCKVPQIRHASVDRLLNRLTDLRFLSIDFLNTFLVTYRCFTDPTSVINSLKRILQFPEYGNLDPRPSFSYHDEMEEEFDPPAEQHQIGLFGRENCTNQNPSTGMHHLLINPQTDKIRRISTGMMRIEVTGEGKAPTHRTGSLDAAADARLSPRTVGVVRPVSILVSSASTRRTTTNAQNAMPGTDSSMFYTPVKQRLQPRGPFADERPFFDLLTNQSAGGDILPRISAPVINKPPISNDEHRDVGLAPIAACEVTSEIQTEIQNIPSSKPQPHEDGDFESDDEELVALQMGSKSNAVLKLKDVVKTESSTDDEQVSHLSSKFQRPCIPSLHLSTMSNVSPGSCSSPFDSVSITMRSPIRVGGTSHMYEPMAKENYLSVHEDAAVHPMSLSSMAPKTTANNNPPPTTPQKSLARMTRFQVQPIRIPESNLLDHKSLTPGGLPQPKRSITPINSPSTKSCILPRVSSPQPYFANVTMTLPPQTTTNSCLSIGGSSGQINWPRGSIASCGENASSKIVNWPRGSIASCGESTSKFLAFAKRPATSWNDSCDMNVDNTPRHSMASTSGGDVSPPCRPKLGAVVTSSRASRRRSSNTAAALAFAVATAGSANPPGMPSLGVTQARSFGEQQIPVSIATKRLSVISTAATMRVLNVIRHWVSKFAEDIEGDPQLYKDVENLLEDLVCSQNLIPADHKAVLQLLRQFKTNSLTEPKLNLEVFLKPTTIPSQEDFDSLSALDLAEQLTYIDHHIFCSIRSEELLAQAWMKDNKETKAIHVLYVSSQFNHVSRLVVSEIVRRTDISDRVATIEKWVAIADICRCMHNYNGVLQICAALVNSSVYRLKRTWEKLAKQTRQMIERLQTLVSSDGRFKNMREALHRCDPPCIPYLGMFLTDLSFIEEGTINVTDEGLVNFCKMRMVAHVIREIQQYQQTAYRIEPQPKASDYLLDPTRILDDELTYQASLTIEPRQSIVQRGSSQGPY